MRKIRAAIAAPVLFRDMLSNVFLCNAAHVCYSNLVFTL